MKKSKSTVTRNAAELAKALGFTSADGAEIALRSDLNSKIVEVVQRQGLTHAQVAKKVAAIHLGTSCALSTSPSSLSEQISW